MSNPSNLHHLSPFLFGQGTLEPQLLGCILAGLEGLNHHRCRLNLSLVELWNFLAFRWPKWLGATTNPSPNIFSSTTIVNSKAILLQNASERLKGWLEDLFSPPLEAFKGSKLYIPAVSLGPNLSNWNPFSNFMPFNATSFRKPTKMEWTAC